MKKWCRFCLICFFILFVTPVYAAELAGVEIHGFVSQGFLYSSDNNYLTAKTSDGSFQFNEMGINFGKDLTDDLRLGIQMISRDLGEIGNNELEIDFAYGDYRWKDWLGLRAGLIKVVSGLYGETRDMDMLRTSVFLPQSVYSDFWRDFYTRVWGAGLYGDISLNKFGSIEYTAIVGSYSPNADNSGIPIQVGDAAPIAFKDFDNGIQYNGSLLWRTPLDGLRFSATGIKAPDLKADISTTVPLGPFPAGTETIRETGFRSVICSGEYTWEDLTVAAEYFYSDIDSTLPLMKMTSQLKWEGYYMSASYRFTDWFELGSYYSVYYSDKDDKDGERYEEDSFRAWQKDFALTTRFDINENWVVKLEGHYMDGAAFLLESDNPDDFEQDWFFFATKVTFSF